MLGLHVWPQRAFAVVLLCVFVVLVINLERKEFQRLPFVGKFFLPKAA
jgi:hypothetical protein